MSLVDYLLDTWGSCDRDKLTKNDCFWGKDAQGKDNGCLKTGWKGRNCLHWHPLGATTYEQLSEIRKEYNTKNGSR
jgi:hypothetical protein